MGDNGSDSEEEEGINDPNFVWPGVCLDDGTGRDVYYVKRDFSVRQRRVPHGYRPEHLENGERRYYYRKTCIRCRKFHQVPILMSYESGSIAYSLNYCEECMLVTTPGTSRLRGNGRLIWEANEDTPKNAWINLKKLAEAEDRDEKLHERALEAKHSSRWDMKMDRNRQRTLIVKELGVSYDVDVRESTHLSWGFEDNYDEYFGLVNKNDETGELQPHGYGVKIYSDGTIYFGEWVNGEYHTDNCVITVHKRVPVGNLIKPTGATYEGQWYTGLKHGKGTQIYPDGARYEGEFAKGYEHGQGKKKYADGSCFEGRFRFGRKDGPGVFTDAQGIVEKGNFLDPTEKYNEKLPPFVSEVPNPNENYYHPQSLRELSVEALAKAMHLNRKQYGPASKLQRMIPEHLKYSVGQEYLRIMYPKGSESFMDIGPNYAFNFRDDVIFESTKIIEPDAQALMYFQNSNFELKTLKCTANKMTLPSIDLICKNLQQHSWPKLNYIDLSFNIFDVSALSALFAGLANCTTLGTLSLRACGINSQGASVVSNALKNDKQLKTVDLAFNNLELVGSECIAQMLESNESLTSLNVRSNRIGALGGLCFIKSLAFNKTMKVLVVADNAMGPDINAKISGRLNGNFRDVLTCSKNHELKMHPRYIENRYSRFEKMMKKYKKEESGSD